MLKLQNITDRFFNTNLCRYGHHLFDNDTIRDVRAVSEKVDDSGGEITLTKEIEAIQPCTRFGCKFSRKVRGYIMLLIWPDGPGYHNRPIDWCECEDEKFNALNVQNKVRF